MFFSPSLIFELRAYYALAGLLYLALAEDDFCDFFEAIAIK
ncbi:MAG TPA: hypothetical protein VE956_07420 [Nodularia sp. (in: cyanobacteria)]|nr:hypothetical protein [Nodularia sp. (in: cyanobacteria)]